MYSRDSADMVDILSESLERPLGLLSRALRRRLPLLARRIGAPRKVHPIPELAMHPLARMIEDADQPAALAAQPVGDFGNLLLCRLHGSGVVQVHARPIRAHVID